MARIKDITFEAGSLTGTSGFSTTPTGTVVLDTAAPLKNTTSVRVNPASAAVSYGQVDYTATADLFVSMYVRLVATPSVATRIIVSLVTNTVRGNIQLTTSRTLVLRNGSTTIGSASATLALNTLYRVGFRQNATGTLEAYLAEGDAAFATPFASSTTLAAATQANRLRIGSNEAATVNLLLDDIRIDDAAMPGPSSSGGAASPTPVIVWW